MISSVSRWKCTHILHEQVNDYNHTDHVSEGKLKGDISVCLDTLYIEALI
jgi:hypothetical protein